VWVLALPQLPCPSNLTEELSRYGKLYWAGLIKEHSSDGSILVQDVASEEKFNLPATILTTKVFSQRPEKSTSVKKGDMLFAAAPINPEKRKSRWTSVLYPAVLTKHFRPQDKGATVQYSESRGGVSRDTKFVPSSECLFIPPPPRWNPSY
jgi:hypothetical protein